MFRDVLRQVRLARGLAGTFVVTGDDTVGAIASAAGAEVIREKVENGETLAVDYARAELKRAGCESVLIIPGDMPLVRASDFEYVIAQVPIDAAAPFALLVPSHDRLGTNALLLAPPDVIKLRFGYDSFTFHLSHIALDIDEPRDLERFLSYGLKDGEATQVALKLLAEQYASESPRSGDV